VDQKYYVIADIQKEFHIISGKVFVYQVFKNGVRDRGSCKKLKLIVLKIL
jgi:hypothetical protein